MNDEASFEATVAKIIHQTFPTNAQMPTEDVVNLMEAILRAHHKAVAEAYDEGLWQFAWMKDGSTYVGTVGTTLKEAQAANPYRAAITHPDKTEVCKGCGGSGKRRCFYVEHDCPLPDTCRVCAGAGKLPQGDGE